ncbi:glycosyltransferase BC10-like [Abrus precatorius]|uniref:Glycosyltransferase BC10-like n=1 Tax=Abrus precatorius TaxID=3816 RepID=A0A8B8JP59_ABRPR|nr:glycosyltransferase BC10-like [Abrus precatorius]
MLSPNPLSLLCALLLCLPLAIFFTTTTNTKHATTTNPTPIIFNRPMPNLKNKNISIPENPNNKSQPPLEDDDDELLFQVATHVKSKPIRPNKIAFMFLTTMPLPFAPLWEFYFNQTSNSLFNVYVHADPTLPYDKPFSGIFSNRIIVSKPTMRLSPTLAAAARRLLAHALIHDPSNSMFVLLSPSCIPLHSFNFTYHALLCPGKSFIEILAHEVGSYDRWAARGPHAMLPAVKLEEFRIGSQFWALTRQHAKLVASDRLLWPKFNVPCVRLDSCYPEENYFPTLLNMWDSEGCVHATLTHVNWTGRVDGHPRTYEPWEVGPNLIRRMRLDRPRYGNGNGRSDPFLFARKFAPDALEPLMRIANDVIFCD